MDYFMCTPLFHTHYWYSGHEREGREIDILERAQYDETIKRVSFTR